MIFQHYIGIDYSGAKAPESRLKALQVYTATQDGPPKKLSAPAENRKNWSRREIARYCKNSLETTEPVIIGIDHGFSFPLSYMQRYAINSWDSFLDDFIQHWPTAVTHTHVESVRDNNPRTGESSALRLCEQWTATAKSVFQFDVRGSVAKSTHAGLPWLWWLRNRPKIRSRVHFWPFDGFEIPAGKSVITEAYPALYKRRFAKNGRTADEQDAWSIAAWLQETDRRGSLVQYFTPPLTAAERQQAQLEGWIIGVC